LTVSRPNSQNCGQTRRSSNYMRLPTESLWGILGTVKCHRVVKVNLSLHTHYEGIHGKSRYSSTHLNLGYIEVRGQLHAPVALQPEKKPGSHRTGGWWGPQPVWAFWIKQEISFPCRDYNSGRSNPYPGIFK
jgi:hypothetical protein